MDSYNTDQFVELQSLLAQKIKKTEHNINWFKSFDSYELSPLASDYKQKIGNIQSRIEDQQRVMGQVEGLKKAVDIFKKIFTKPDPLSLQLTWWFFYKDGRADKVRAENKQEALARVDYKKDPKRKLVYSPSGEPLVLLTTPSEERQIIINQENLSK